MEYVPGSGSLCSSCEWICCTRVFLFNLSHWASFIDCSLYLIDVWIQLHDVFQSSVRSKWVLFNFSFNFVFACKTKQKKLSYWFNLYLMANFLILQLCLLLPFTLIFMFFIVSWWFLHSLLNQTASLVFNNFSLMFLKL